MRGQTGRGYSRRRRRRRGRPRARQGAVHRCCRAYRRLVERWWWAIGAAKSPPSTPSPAPRGKERCITASGSIGRW
ncbi:Os02g0467400 [Oryza sativa Japonica Group]|uniref:Os02g0467400 protein n=1 Tax=Oryza sativa subsp. japonica TaxID=39947 RepID=Q6K7B2_ORYSJ|nr:unknown protein [Oryza sativa Japonica Group]BAF08732.1 Os02g0467400 [Oryza sativa Japonica Group]|eukprot:NP_001046818.1 Os02g0467400 [Oryza sativa Japonica Group]